MTKVACEISSIPTIRFVLSCTFPLSFFSSPLGTSFFH